MRRRACVDSHVPNQEAALAALTISPIRNTAESIPSGSGDWAEGLPRGTVGSCEIAQGLVQEPRIAVVGFAASMPDPCCALRFSR